MCLVTTQTEPLIAKEDIICYKILSLVDYIFFKKFKSPMRSFNWRLNKIYKSEIKILKKRTYHHVENGFHALTNNSKINDHYIYILAIDPIVFRAIIPAGSEYYTSFDGEEITSNQMKIVKKL